MSLATALYGWRASAAASGPPGAAGHDGPPGAGGTFAPEQGEGVSTELGVPMAMKLAFVFALAAMTLFDRFGLRVSAAYSVSPGLVALYVVVAVLLFKNLARLSLRGAALYVGIVTIACLSFMVNYTLDVRQLASLGSMALLCVLYLPVVLEVRPEFDTAAWWRWFMRAYIVFAAILAVCGIVQFYAQFVVRVPWLFDFTEYIPIAIRGSGEYNTTNHADTVIKSNGFFLREASGFSFIMAFALICEWSFFKRKWLMALFVMGVVVSYSGSGPVTLLLALFFPFGRQTVMRVVGVLAAAVAFYLLFGEALNLNYTLGRVSEFTSPYSSAYCRFISPAKVVADQIESQSWAALLGHGPGTTQKLSGACETTYGKVMFEYGIVGWLAFFALILSAVTRSWMPTRLRAALVFQWYMLGGNLLAPEALLQIFLLSAMWPRRAAQAEPGAAGGESAGQGALAGSTAAGAPDAPGAPTAPTASAGAADTSAAGTRNSAAPRTETSMSPTASAST